MHKNSNSCVGDPQRGLFLWVVSKITWVLASATFMAVCLGEYFNDKKLLVVWLAYGFRLDIVWPNGSWKRI
jgi:hypothetical protein